MNKRPSVQFYPNDWIGDAELSMCSASTRGVWVTAFCKMWHSNRCGIISGTKEQLCRSLACNEVEFEKFIEELKQTNFGNLTVANKIITIGNRRLIKEEKARKANAERQKRHYDKNLQPHNDEPNEKLTTPSSSSSSTTTTNKEYISIFNDARKLFGGTKRGNETEFHNFTRKHKDWREVLPLIKPAIETQSRWRQNVSTGDFRPPWKNFQTWINNRCWEDEVNQGTGSPGDQHKPPPPNVGPDGKTPGQRLREKIESDKHE